MKKLFSLIILTTLLGACSNTTPEPSTATPTLSVQPVAISTTTSRPTALWIAPGVPDPLRGAATASGVPVTDDPQLATLTLGISDSGTDWIYALVAPFPTVLDGVSSADLLSAWKGAPTGPFVGRALLMADSTLRAFSAIWGEPASGAVRSVPAGELLDVAWLEMSAFAIIPFEEIQPKWKVLSVDDQSPLHKDFDSSAYPLQAHFALSQPDALPLPETNRDPSKLATVILTGVTALVRATAATMEMRGVTFPGSLVRDWMRQADIAHVSNEVAFDKTCPYPNPSYTNFILCSDPKYMELLLDVGTDVVELTGDHFADRGYQAMLDTLQMYKDNNLLYYGGGANADEARKPLLMDINGNKLAFMGCNGKRASQYPKANATTPGAADCDYDFFVKQVQDVKAQGYLVIFTFQHEECYSYGPCFNHEPGFHAVADAGATVVSGSQAHYPHIMEFRGDSFIHYGLGNLFFDQMTYTLPDGKVIDGTRREFLDRHVFYDGHYLGVEFLTAMLEDYARPRPMNEAERTAFLSDYFYQSGFIPFSPTPIPAPTTTLTPIALPQVPATPTP